MKALLLLLLGFALALPRPVFGFKYPPELRLAKARVQLVGNREVSGSLYAVTDAGITISMIETVIKLGQPIPNNIIVPVKEIQSIRLWRSGSTQMGGVLGGIFGMVIGGVVGAMAHKSCDSTPGLIGLSECSFEVVDQTGATVIGAALGAISGTGIGILIGTKSKRIVINGSQQVFEQQKRKMVPYFPKVK